MQDAAVGFIHDVTNVVASEPSIAALCWLVFYYIIAAIATDKVASLITGSDIAVWLRSNTVGRLAYPKNPPTTKLYPTWLFVVIDKFFSCMECTGVWLSILAATYMPGSKTGPVPTDQILMKAAFIAGLATVWESIRRGRMRSIQLEPLQLSVNVTVADPADPVDPNWPAPYDPMQQQHG